LRSVAYIQVSSAKSASWVPGVWGPSLICKLYSSGERTEPCGTPAYISFGVDNSSSTETLNFLLERNELISFIVLAERFNLISLYSKPGGVKCFFDVQEYRSRREIVKI